MNNDEKTLFRAKLTVLVFTDSQFHWNVTPTNSKGNLYLCFPLSKKLVSKTWSCDKGILAWSGENLFSKLVVCSWTNAQASKTVFPKVRSARKLQMVRNTVLEEAKMWSKLHLLFKKILFLLSVRYCYGSPNIICPPLLKNLEALF